MELVAFLLARIGEDMRKARGQLELQAERYPDEKREPGDPRFEVERGWGLYADPAFVLADCEAKVRIVEDQSGGYTWREGFAMLSPTIRRWGPGGPDEVEISFGDGPGERLPSAEFRERYMQPSPPSRVLRLLAATYADHPDYRSEWKP
ncbi:MAG: hypothetical protein HOV76_32420 [Hamadaea sp.]|nr:hypothetical protein [Hamadaea sp.]